MICDRCAWNYSGERYPFCETVRKGNPSDCSRFIEYMSLGSEASSKSKVCVVCKRDKDPGKCWWCGN